MKVNKHFKAVQCVESTVKSGKYRNNFHNLEKEYLHILLNEGF